MRLSGVSNRTLANASVGGTWVFALFSRETQKSPTRRMFEKLRLGVMIGHALLKASRRIICHIVGVSSVVEMTTVSLAPDPAANAVR